MGFNTPSHPMDKREDQGLAKREKQVCAFPYGDRQEDACGGSEPTSMEKENVVTYNGKFSAAFQSNEPDVPTALDFKNSVECGGKVRNRTVSRTMSFI